MILRNRSTRTRVSFEVGMWQLGGYALYLGQATFSWAGERPSPIQPGCCPVTQMGSWRECLPTRPSSNWWLIRESRSSTVSPIIPIPARGWLTCSPSMKRRSPRRLKLAYVGDGNNVAHSLIYGCSKVGYEHRAGLSKGYEPDPQVVSRGKKSQEDRMRDHRNQ